MLEIFAIPAFTDNYIWALRKEKQLVVVDPGDPNAVQDILLKENLDLIAILITHWHPDHTGGLLELSKEKAIPVYGPKGGHIEEILLRFLKHLVTHLIIFLIFQIKKILFYSVGTLFFLEDVEDYLRGRLLKCIIHLVNFLPCLKKQKYFVRMNIH